MWMRCGRADHALGTRLLVVEGGSELDLERVAGER